ncbi:MAG: MBL fold metallo-hydrolase [Lachnospiraceae bacterium]|nr:MBL fold metallo-hydrolase [Lachnospiraceae bacterium]
MRLCSIASGSSGNCIYVGNDNAHFIVDCGISGKKIEEGLNLLDLTLSDLDGIFVTHEHEDHIHSLGVLHRKYPVPIYATKGTMDYIKGKKGMNNIPDEMFRVVKADESLNVSGIKVLPVKISHDAAEPVAYRFDDGKKSAAVLTDLGKYDDYIINSMKGVNSIVLEANHDIHMLEVGPYRYPLKMRILSDKGHLSNDSAGQLLTCLLHDNINHILLGHLSKENNMAELAYETVRMEVNLSDNSFNCSDFDLTVAFRDEPTRCFDV